MAKIQFSDAEIKNMLDARSQFSAPYTELAKGIAIAAGHSGVLAADSKKTRTAVWGQFKEAVTIANASGHNASTMRLGLETACVLAEVPAGTMRGYLSTIENLKADVDSGKMPQADFEAISVKDARELYQSDAAKLLTAAKQRLSDATHGWTVENLDALTALCAGIAAPAVRKVKKAKVEAVAA